MKNRLSSFIVLSFLLAAACGGGSKASRLVQDDLVPLDGAGLTDNAGTEDGLGLDVKTFPDCYSDCPAPEPECTVDRDCPEGYTCVAHACVPKGAPAIITEALPDGTVGDPYSVLLEAKDGQAPYTFGIESGLLPPGISFGSNGKLAGTPTQADRSVFRAWVKDSNAKTSSREFVLVISERGSGEALSITDETIPDGVEGEEYSHTMQAKGGTSPYYWAAVQGLPAGLALGSDGVISGAPEKTGDYEVRIKVFDSGEPTSSATKDFAMTVSVAPLTVTGDQTFDLFGLTLVVLPLLVADNPFGYETQLQAKGGVKPYQWEYVGGLDLGIFAAGGLPGGLSVDEDGVLSGKPTDQANLVEIKQIGIAGYFFTAVVRDSQDPVDEATGIFLLPTMEITGN